MKQLRQTRPAYCGGPGGGDGLHWLIIILTLIMAFVIGCHAIALMKGYSPYWTH